MTCQLPFFGWTGDGRTAWKNSSGEISTWSESDPDDAAAGGVGLEGRRSKESQESQFHPVLACFRSGDTCEDLMYFLKTHFRLTSTIELEKLGQDMLASMLPWDPRRKDLG